MFFQDRTTIISLGDCPTTLLPPDDIGLCYQSAKLIATDAVGPTTLTMGHAHPLDLTSIMFHIGGIVKDEVLLSHIVFIVVGFVSHDLDRGSKLHTRSSLMFQKQLLK